MTGIDEITKRIPHRAPALLVDEVTAVEPGRRLTARRLLTAGSTGPAIGGRPGGGHPGPPYPTHLLLESWAQAALLLVLWEAPLPDPLAGRVALAGAIDDVHIVGRAYQGDLLEHRARLVRAVADYAIVLGETTVDAKTVLEVGHFVVALRSIDRLEAI
jgi:3-hydroxyacyl-[acyl-carrier-protein] dehydratase